MTNPPADVEISRTKQTSASRCEASRMKLLANEKEQVRRSLATLGKTRRKGEQSISRCFFFPPSRGKIGRKKIS